MALPSAAVPPADASFAATRLRVAALLAAGMSVREIAEEIGVALMRMLSASISAC